MFLNNKIKMNKNKINNPLIYTKLQDITGYYRI